MSAGSARGWALAAALAAAAVVLAGCGLGAGPAPSAIQLLVTRDFGGQVLVSSGAPRAAGAETVMSLLMRNASVSTRYGGGYVQSIDGLASGREHGYPVDWFYYVNGVLASKGAAETDVRSGDHIWWDRHNWNQSQEVPAVVGSFPEPFLNGIEGKRLPVRVECAPASGGACDRVTSRLRALDVPAAVSAIGSGGAPETLRVMVGPWIDLSGDLEAQGIAEGPRASGVYARFTARGHALELLDQDGVAVQTLRAGAGLIAATRRSEEAPVWVITGTDHAGVEAAAAHFDRAALDNHFAVAVSSAGAVALPEATR
jgi:hypothetical protein